MNWMTLAEQLPGFCWMVALVAAIAIVLLGQFGKPSEPAEEEEPLSPAELAVSKCLWIYSNHTMESSRKAAPGFVRHLCMMGFALVRPSDVCSAREVDEQRQIVSKMRF